MSCVKGCLVTCCTVLLALASTGYSLESGDVQVCQTLLDASWKAFEDQGKDAMVTTIAGQYESSPSGPYVFCYGNIQEGQENSLDMIRFVHPYLELDEAVGTTVQSFDAANAAEYEGSYQNASIKAVQDCCGELFNFTVNYNQAKSQVSEQGQAVAGTVRSYLGFGAKDNGGYFMCGCPTSNIPSGDRNNANVAVLKAASSAFSHPMSSTTILFAWLLLLLVVAA